MSDDRRFGWSFDDLKTLTRGAAAKPGKVAVELKTFCPTGPGGGVDPTCGPKDGKKERSSLLSPQMILGGPWVPQDKFMDYLEKHGQEYASQPLPKGIKKGVMKQCYMNATKLAISKRDLTYVEGLAYTPQLPPGMAVAHAWVVDKAGKVIDNTWPNPEKCQYFGMPVPTTRLEMWAVKTKVYGIFGGATPEARDLIMNGEKP